MTEAHLRDVLEFLRKHGNNLLATADDSTTDLDHQERTGLVRSSTGVLVAAKAFKDLWNERDEADRAAGAAARKIHQLQRQLDRLKDRQTRHRNHRRVK